MIAVINRVQEYILKKARGKKEGMDESFGEYQYNVQAILMSFRNYRDWMEFTSWVTSVSPFTQANVKKIR